MQVRAREDVRVDKAITKQLERAKKKFVQMDLDGNGVLDGDELLSLVDWVFDSFHPGGEKMSDQKKDMEVVTLLKQLDSDGDGVLDYAEFEEWFCRTAEDIYRVQRRKAADARAAAKAKAEEAAEAARVAREAKRVTDRENLLSQLLFDVRKELVVSLVGRTRGPPWVLQ